MADKEAIKAYIENRLTLGADTLRAMTVDSKGQTLPKRSVFLVVDKCLRDFSQRRAEPRWIVIPLTFAHFHTAFPNMPITRLRSS
jgi:hypothetical protein